MLRSAVRPSCARPSAPRTIPSRPVAAVSIPRRFYAASAKETAAAARDMDMRPYRWTTPPEIELLNRRVLAEYSGDDGMNILHNPAPDMSFANRFTPAAGGRRSSVRAAFTGQDDAEFITRAARGAEEGVEGGPEPGGPGYVPYEGQPQTAPQGLSYAPPQYAGDARPKSDGAAARRRGGTSARLSA